MEQLSITGCTQLVKHTCIRLNEPVMIVGRFGVGKSALINQLADELNHVEALQTLLGEDNKYSFTDEEGTEQEAPFEGCMVCDVRLSQYESVDLRGFPGVNKATGFTVWHAPATMPFIGNDEFPDNKIIILFLDELTSAQPSVATVAYQLINERRIGEHMLKPNVRIVAAGNRDDDKGVVNRMPMPLCNRMTWAESIVSHVEWGEWAQSQGVPPVIIAFIHFKPTLLMTYDPAKSEKVVATPRTWAKAALYHADPHMPPEIKQASIAGAIGSGPAKELEAFIAIWHKVTPIKDIIADPDGTKVPTEASMRFATAISISGAMTKKTLAPLYQFLKRMPPEMVVLAWQLANKRDASLYSTPEFMDFTKRYRSVFNI